jgi:CRISPR-associated exonuclease Cas4
MAELPQFTGTEFGYYFICKRKLWWFNHGLQMEQESDRAKLGKVVHENSYDRQKKEIDIDGRIVLDWREDNIIHEVKLTDSMESSHEMQLLYYIYYLKKKGVEGLRGRIDYPKLKQFKLVELTEALEKKIEESLSEMEEIVKEEFPPSVEWMKICRSCSYSELCWG